MSVQQRHASITGVSPSSAFVSAPQPATITGSALSLQNAVNTTASFGAAAASNVVVVDDATITCTTPAPGLLGANSVSVQNAFGSDALPSGAFRMYQYPVDLVAADAPVEAEARVQTLLHDCGMRYQVNEIASSARLTRHALSERSVSPLRCRLCMCVCVCVCVCVVGC